MNNSEIIISIGLMKMEPSSCRCLWHPNFPRGYEGMIEYGCWVKG
jgi:hypothetical protein